MRLGKVALIAVDPTALRQPVPHTDDGSDAQLPTTLHGTPDSGDSSSTVCRCCYVSAATLHSSNRQASNGHLPDTSIAFTKTTRTPPFNPQCHCHCTSVSGCCPTCHFPLTALCIVLFPSIHALSQPSFECCVLCCSDAQAPQSQSSGRWRGGGSGGCRPNNQSTGQEESRASQDGQGRLAAARVRTAAAGRAADRRADSSGRHSGDGRRQRQAAGAERRAASEEARAIQATTSATTALVASCAPHAAVVATVPLARCVERHRGRPDRQAAQLRAEGGAHARPRGKHRSAEAGTAAACLLQNTTAQRGGGTDRTG